MMTWFYCSSKWREAFIIDLTEEEDTGKRPQVHREAGGLSKWLRMDSPGVSRVTEHVKPTNHCWLKDTFLTVQTKVLIHR